MYFVEDNASDTVESSVSSGLNLHLYESRQILTCISLIQPRAGRTVKSSFLLTLCVNYLKN